MISNATIGREGRNTSCALRRADRPEVDFAQAEPALRAQKIRLVVHEVRPRSACGGRRKPCGQPPWTPSSRAYRWHRSGPLAHVGLADQVMPSSADTPSSQKPGVTSRGAGWRYAWRPRPLPRRSPPQRSPWPRATAGAPTGGLEAAGTNTANRPISVARIARSDWYPRLCFDGSGPSGRPRSRLRRCRSC